jgi:hypothetical protein
MGWCDPYGGIRLLEEINAKAQRRKGSGSPVEIRLFGFSPEGGTCLPVCVRHRIWGGSSIQWNLMRYEFCLHFDPIRSNLAGLFKLLAVGCGLNEIAPSANSSGA